MEKTRIWLDCDPGLDDAAALFMALGAADRLQLEGISTVAGNVGIAPVTRNARGLLALAGREDIPLHAGCPRPMMSSPVDAAHVHGSDGIGGVPLPAPSVPPRAGHAIEAIDAFCRRGMTGARGTLVLTGPMTNAALAIIRAPDMLAGLDRIVFMGGVAFGAGNVTPAAEFNFACDPHAAKIVLGSGVPCVMMGLDVTRQAEITPARIAALAAAGPPVGESLAAMMTAYHGRVGKPVLHDPCTIAWLLQPDLFSGCDCHVDVDCESSLNLGRCVVDLHRVTGKPANTSVMTRLNAQGFFDLMTDCVGRI
ncbi:MAG: nucleoside hydrolase [Alphaproteobacteria bacterium]|nr:nucleoside hydrolase [Alphaproteobacteria bacterium]